MEHLIKILLERSVKRGDFILKSGKKSDLYVDVRMTALHDEGSVAIAQSVLNVLDDVQYIGGVELGAVPIVGSVIAMNRFATDGIRDDLEDKGAGLPALHGFVVRKAAKAHGLARKIENCPPAGTRVAIIEDVTTTGGSLLAAIQAAQEAGLEVVQAITVVDRLEGAGDLLAVSGYTGEFTALVTRTDLIG